MKTGKTENGMRRLRAVLIFLGICAALIVITMAVDAWHAPVPSDAAENTELQQTPRSWWLFGTYLAAGSFIVTAVAFTLCDFFRGRR